MVIALAFFTQKSIFILLSKLCGKNGKEKLKNAFFMRIEILKWFGGFCFVLNLSLIQNFDEKIKYLTPLLCVCLKNSLLEESGLKCQKKVIHSLNMKNCKVLK